jgi:hypothetical protein
MSKRTLSILGMASGVLIIIAALLMGYFGFPSAGFGPRKIAIGLFGLLVLIVGIILFFWKQIHVGIIDSSKYSWTTLFGFTFLSVYVYILFEWIFTITKPSFLDLVPFSTKVGILFFTSAMVACLAFLAITIFFALSRLPWFRKSSKLFLALASFIPVWIIASMILILVDNFTFTLFSFGIVNTETIGRIIYLVAYTFLFIFILAKVPKILSDISSVVDRWKTRKFLVPALIVVIVASLLITYRNNNQSSNLDITKQSGTNTYPNIILITADGVNADHMSLYGYQLDTTPRLKDLGETSLIAENAFPNSSTTISALLAIFTSKDPLELRVQYSEDILKDADSYQHLPGILRTLGYYTAQFSNPTYADAYDANMLSAFDYSNGRSISEGTFYNFINKYFIPDYSYFIYETTNRLFDRLNHIFFIKKMVNQQALVEDTGQFFNDQAKIDNLESVLSSKNQPVFIDIHWMGTHGSKFILKKQVFSAGENPADQGHWNDAFYADSILEFDNGVGEIVDFLKAQGLFDKTIIIVSSDHGEKWISTSRIPLLIHFPDGQYPGIRESDIQQLDIAPTILDYLGIQKPSWMHGESFLRGELPNHPIFSTSLGNVQSGETVLKPESLKPPFYQFGAISVVYCNSWLTLHLETNQINTGLIEGHTQPCSADTVSKDQIITWIIEHLKENGFDTSTIATR